MARNTAHKGKFSRDEIVQAIVKNVLVDCFSKMTVLTYLKEELGYKHAYAYELIAQADKYIAEVYKDYAVKAIERRIADLEEQRESAKRSKDMKLCLEITKEINKISQLYVERTEISGTIKIDRQIIILPDGSKLEI